MGDDLDLEEFIEELNICPECGARDAEAFGRYAGLCRPCGRERERLEAERQRRNEIERRKSGYGSWS